MLQQIKLQNFKCFKKVNIKLKNFNVVCGPNSSGKTTINQGVLLHLQNNRIDKEHFITNGKYVHFDDFAELKNSATSSDKDVVIELFNEKNQKRKIVISSQDDGKKIKCKEYISEFDILDEKNIFYLSANRIGPEDVYNKFTSELIEQYGQNAIGFLAKYQNQPIDEKYAFIKYPTKDYQFIKEINYWLNEIVGEQVHVTEISRTDKSTATYSHEVNSLEVRNKNTGSGVSYVIAILVMAFSLAIKKNEETPLIIIENPEIHLHPLGQIKLMTFLKFMSQFCQIIVETHSDHIIKNFLQYTNGQVIKLNKDYVPIYYNKRSKYTLKTLTLGEVQWTAFDLPTIDFHVSLLSYLQAKFNEFSLNKLDDLIRDTAIFKSNYEKYDTRCRRYNNNHSNPKSNYETLPIYMRNVIDHPVKKRGSSEPPRKKYRKTEYEFHEALKNSIQFMLEIIKEKKW